MLILSPPHPTHAYHSYSFLLDSLYQTGELSVRNMAICQRLYCPAPNLQTITYSSFPSSPCCSNHSPATLTPLLQSHRLSPLNSYVYQSPSLTRRGVALANTQSNAILHIRNNSIPNNRNDSSIRLLPLHKQTRRWNFIFNILIRHRDALCCSELFEFFLVDCLYGIECCYSGFGGCYGTG